MKAVKIIFALMCCVFMCNLCNPIVVKAEEGDVYDSESEIEIRLSDIINENVLSEMAQGRLQSTGQSQVLFHLKNPDTGENMIDITVKYTYTYSDGVSVAINSITEVNITRYSVVEMWWNGSGQITNLGYEARYARDFVLRNTVTNVTKGGKFTLIVDVYAAEDMYVTYY